MTTNGIINAYYALLVLRLKLTAILQNISSRELSRLEDDISSGTEPSAIDSQGVPEPSVFERVLLALTVKSVKQAKLMEMEQKMQQSGE